MTSYHPPLRPTPPHGFPAPQLRDITPLDVKAVMAHAPGFPLTAAPVSYTHLDVYKRQVLGS